MDPQDLRHARSLLEAALFHSDTERLLRAALKARYAGMYCWIQDASDAEVIFELEPKGVEGSVSTLYRAPYSIDDANQVSIGDPERVERKTTYVSVTPPTTATESADTELGGEFVPLVEKAVRRDGTVPIKVIQPGRGSSGFYPAEVLERDGPKVFTAGTKMYVDHPTPTEEAERPERSLRDLAAEFVSDARWEAEGKAGPGLYADAKVFAPWQPFVEELAPHIGVSIRALGKAKMGEVDGERMPIVEELVSAKSVDFVTAAGAGGQILSLVESARKRAAVEMTPTYLEADMANEQELKEAREALAAKEAEVATLTEANTEKDRELARLREGEILREARVFVLDTLPADLPELTRSRLAESLSLRPMLADGALDKAAYKTAIEEAVKAEVDYLAKVTGSGRVRDMGGAPTTECADSDALAEAFRDMGYSEETAKLMATGR